MADKDEQAPSGDEPLSSLAVEFDVFRPGDAREDGVVPDILVNLSDSISLGRASLTLYDETHEEGHLLAAYEIAKSLPVQTISLSAECAPALELFLEDLHRCLCLHAEVDKHPALDYAAAISRLSLVLRPAEIDTRSDFLNARAKGLVKLFYQGDHTPAVALPLLMEAIILVRHLVTLATTDENRLELCEVMASLLRIYRERNGERVLDVSNEEIGVRREILHARQAHGSEQHDFACDYLATLLSTHFDQTGDIALLDEALALDREVLGLRPEGHPERAGSCVNLANSLRSRFNQTGDTPLLDEALELEREALRLRPEGHPERAGSYANLANSLGTRFNQTGETALLDEAFVLHREALQLRPEGHSGRALSCHNLAVSLWNRFNQTGDMALLDEALELQREALRLRPAGHPRRASSCANLANLLRTRFDQTGDTVLLDEALELDREALRLCPKGHSGRALSCENLAVSLWTRSNQTGDMALLDEALELQREALRLRPAGHPERARSCANLANSLRTRFDQTGDTVLLDDALELTREALRLRPEGHPQRALSCENLANSLRTRLNPTGDTVLLDDALELDREALRLRPEGHPDRARSCANLAESLWIRFNQTGDTVLLDQALALETEALRLRPEGHPDRALSCISLSIMLRTRFEQTADTTLLHEAQSLCIDSIKEPGLSASQQVALRVELACIHAVPTYSSQCAFSPVTLFSEMIQHRPGLIPHFYTVSSALAVYDKTNVSGEDNARLLAVYKALIEVLPELGTVILDKMSRLRRWLRAANLPQDALLHALKANDISLGLELLEQGRAVLWSQTLAMQGSQLQRLSEEWRTPLQTLLRSTNSFSEQAHTQQSDSTARDQAYTSYNQLQQLLKEIRASPGLERFMRGPSYSELAQVASAHPVVIIAADDTSCHAVVMSSTSASPAHLILDRITPTDLETLGHDIRGLDLNARAMSGVTDVIDVRGIMFNGRRRWEDLIVGKLHRALARLWVGVVKPILDSLSLETATGRSRRRIHWCPIGSLAFLPIHAAGIYTGRLQECCSDHVVSSYTPTLSALIRARKNLAPLSRDSLVLLAAGASDTTASRNMPPLHNVRGEIKAVAHLAQATAHLEVLEYGQTSAATVREVTEGLPRANIVHLACHGVQDLDDPLQSGFCLGDGRLTVTELMDVQLDQAILAFLSACETAKGDKDQPDQSIHLAAAMLFCGFRNVIATMWSISDVDGPAVARAFYEALFTEEVLDADAVAYALDTAVSKLRKEGVSPLRWASFIHVGA